MAAALAATIALAAACANDAPATSSFTVRDSAGIEIVESSAPRWEAGTGWSVDPAPILDLATSGTGPPHQFYRVRDALRLADGTIAVADHGSHQVRFYSAAGTFLHAVGRDGEGPGEFQRLTSVDPFRGDSIAVYDYWLRRVTVLSPEMEVARVFSPGGPADRVRELYPIAEAGFIGLVYSYTSVPDEAGYYRMPFGVVTFSNSGAVLDTVAVIAGFEGFTFSRGDARPPFAATGHLAVAGARFALGSADGLAFRQYSAGAGPSRIVRVPAFDLELTKADIDRTLQAMLSHDAPAWYYDLVESMPFPDERPAYSDLVIDSEGYVWAAEYHSRVELGERTDWQVFTPRGEWLGSLSLPPRFTVFEIGSDYVLGRLQDELDVEHVQMLRLVRQADPS